MKIAISQLKPAKGDIETNIICHASIIRTAVGSGAAGVFFPELSLTGYEPTLAKDLAVAPDDARLHLFQSFSNESSIVIGVGLPTDGPCGIHISMVVFQPHAPRQVYSKQYLHNDELPYFVPGSEQLYIMVQGKVIAPAICYESLLLQHAEMANKKGIDLYLTSVAKPANGVAKAYRHYPMVAKTYSVPVLMANCVGEYDNFQSAGSSAAWNKKGKVVGRLDEGNEGLIIFDTETEQTTTVV